MQNEEALTRAIARNIAALRKKQKLTQLQLAEKINYSDKSVSKWERGEGLPDVLVMVRLAELFHVTLNELCGEKPPERTQQKDRRHGLVLLLSEGLVWLVATVFFAAFKLFGLQWTNMWLIFIYALTASAIVGVVFTTLWFKWYYELLSVSALIWSIALSVSLSAPHPQSYMLYVVAAVVQMLALIWFWFRLERRKAQRQSEAQEKAEQPDGDA